MLTHPAHSLPARDRRRAGALRLLFLALATVGLLLSTLGAALAADGGRQVALLKVDGAITPAMADYIDRGIDTAAKRGDTAVILEMDTPGGLSTSMDDIIADILNAPLPVIVYVAPDGARAASAGTYITYAAHVAAMAPTTNIGSASPVNLSNPDQGRGELSTEETKVLNDAIAKIRSLAEKRGRNVDWAESAVRDAANVTASQAAELHVVDFIAANRDELLAKADGRMVEVQGRQVVVQTAGASIDEIEMTYFDRVLQLVSDPNIAYILISLGSLGLVFELANPGLIFPGVVGGLMAVTGFYALGTISGNWAALTLIAFAFLLFVVDVFVPTHGALTAGGIAAFLFGSLMLANSASGASLRLSRALVVGVTAALGAFFILIVVAAARARLRPSVTGKSSLIGKLGVVRRDLDPTGLVYVDGALWEATTAGPPVPVGAQVVVTEVRGLSLLVAPRVAGGPTSAATASAGH